MVKGRSRFSAFDQIDQYHRKDKDTDLYAVDKKVKEDIEKDTSRL